MRVVERAEVERLLADGEPVRLLHAGGPAAFRDAHVPGSIALPSTADAVRLLRPTDRVVVYGSERDCRQARALAGALERALSVPVSYYAGGLADWRQAGGMVEGAQQHGWQATRPAARESR